MQFLKRVMYLLVLFVFTIGFYACPPQSDGPAGSGKSKSDGQTEVVKDSGDSLSKAAQMVLDAENDAAKMADDSAEMIMDAKTHKADIVLKTEEETAEAESEKKE